MIKLMIFINIIIIVIFVIGCLIISKDEDNRDNLIKEHNKLIIKLENKIIELEEENEKLKRIIKLMR